VWISSLFRGTQLSQAGSGLSISLAQTTPRAPHTFTHFANVLVRKMFTQSYEPTPIFFVTFFLYAHHRLPPANPRKFFETFCAKNPQRQQIWRLHMRIDRYTKIILTLVALLLAVSVLRPILQPQAAMADGPTAVSNSRIAGVTTRSSLPALATFGNMAKMATLGSTT